MRVPVCHTAVAVSTSSGKQPQPAACESDSEEEIDFGFWEKASPIPSSTDQQHNNMKEVDLNLL